MHFSIFSLLLWFMTVSQPYSYLGLNNSLLLSSVECLTASILWKNCTTILAYFFNHDKETALGHAAKFVLCVRFVHPAGQSSQFSGDPLCSSSLWNMGEIGSLCLEEVSVDYW
jgi:hypothetical protein